MMRTTSPQFDQTLQKGLVALGEAYSLFNYAYLSSSPHTWPLKYSNLYLIWNFVFAQDDCFANYTDLKKITGS